MALFAVEQWWPDVDVGDVSRHRLFTTHARDTARAEIVEIIVVPGDDLVLYFVEASSVDAARALWGDDAIGIARVQEIVRLSVAPS